MTPVRLGSDPFTASGVDLPPVLAQYDLGTGSGPALLGFVLVIAVLLTLFWMYIRPLILRY